MLKFKEHFFICDKKGFSHSRSVETWNFKDFVQFLSFEFGKLEDLISEKEHGKKC